MLPEITHIIASLIANPPGGRCLSVREAVDLALAVRPLRYGLSTEYALRRYRALRKGTVTPAAGENAALWRELAAKVDRRLAEHPGEDDFTAMEHVLACESPSRYFLTPVYVEKLLYRRLARRRSRLPSPSRHSNRKSHSSHL